MLNGMIAISIVLVATGVFQIFNYGIPSTICVLAFVMIFEFSSGPITWLYMSEIMEDTGTGIASALNWLMNCIVGAVTPYAIQGLTENNKFPEKVGYVFIFCSVLSLCGTLFIYKFMKETKGLSR
jgi:Na+/melibiose symporter-like transporter